MREFRKRTVDIFVAAVGGIIAGAVIANIFSQDVEFNVPMPTVYVAPDAYSDQVPFFIQEAYIDGHFQIRKPISWLPWGKDIKFVNMVIITRVSADDIFNCRLIHKSKMQDAELRIVDSEGSLFGRKLWTSDRSLLNSEDNIIRAWDFKKGVHRIYIRHNYPGDRAIHSMDIKFRCDGEETRFKSVEGFPTE